MSRTPRTITIAALASLALAGCNNSSGNQAGTNVRQIKVTGDEQKQLHQLDAFNLAIALKRAIYDAGYTCKTVTDAGFVATYENLDMWTAHCIYDGGRTRDWAVFAGPDGSAQVRDCKDVKSTGLPECAIKQRPKGSFSAVK
jgi:outer membrane murein-binding lipoprotein Lpp